MARLTKKQYLNKYVYRKNYRGEWHHRVKYYKKYPSTPLEWHVHHIKYYPPGLFAFIKNNQMRNLIALPKALHEWVHYQQDKKGARFNKGKLKKVLKQYLKRPDKFIF